MKGDKVMIIYFSATGNSKYCADILAEKLCDETVNANELIKSGVIFKGESEKPYVFVAPTYAWKMPRVFSDFISKCEFAGNRKAYFVLTCGGGIFGAGDSAKKLAEHKGMKFMGISEVVMPENYIAMFDVPEKEECDSLIKKAEETCFEVSEFIAKGESLPERKISFFNKFMSEVVNGVFYPAFVTNKKFTVKGNCVSCGKCEKLCPLNSITLKDGKPVWSGDCTHCMACISHCPTRAIEYGKKSVGKTRYRCPEWKGK